MNVNKSTVHIFSCQSGKARPRADDTRKARADARRGFNSLGPPQEYGLCDRDLIVLDAMIGHIDEDYTCFPKQRTLAVACRFLPKRLAKGAPETEADARAINAALRRVKRAIRNLRAAGMVEVVRHYTERNGRPNSYRLPLITPEPRGQQSPHPEGTAVSPSTGQQCPQVGDSSVPLSYKPNKEPSINRGQSIEGSSPSLEKPSGKGRRIPDDTLRELAEKCKKVYRTPKVINPDYLAFWLKNSKYPFTKPRDLEQLQGALAIVGEQFAPLLDLYYKNWDVISPALEASGSGEAFSPVTGIFVDRLPDLLRLLDLRRELDKETGDPWLLAAVADLKTPESGGDTDYDFN